MRRRRPGGVNIRLIQSDITKRVSGAEYRGQAGGEGTGVPVPDAALAFPRHGNCDRRDNASSFSRVRPAAQSRGRRPNRPRRFTPARSGTLGGTWPMPSCGAVRAAGSGMSHLVRPGRLRAPQGTGSNSRTGARHLRRPPEAVTRRMPPRLPHAHPFNSVRIPAIARFCDEIARTRRTCRTICTPRAIAVPSHSPRAPFAPALTSARPAWRCAAGSQPGQGGKW